MKITPTPKENKHVNLSYLSPSSATPGDSFHQCGLIGEKNKIKIMREKLFFENYKKIFHSPMTSQLIFRLMPRRFPWTKVTSAFKKRSVFGVPFDQVQDWVQDVFDFRQGLGEGGY